MLPATGAAATIVGPVIPWGALALLAVLHAVCERPPRRPFPGRTAGGPVPAGSVPERSDAVTAVSFFPVLLAAALLLPTSAAALAAVPGALLARVGRRPAAPRRIWRAARLALAVWVAARAAALTGGTLTLDGGAPGAPAPGFPALLLPAGVAALALCLVLTALDGGILATAERVPARDAWRGLLTRSLAPHALHGLAGLMMAVVWRSSYGWPAALLVLLPTYVSCRVFGQYDRERAAHRTTIRALVQAVGIKDAYTRGHSERVGRASELIARELGMDEDRLEVLRFAGTLHDVGKLGVPTRLLRKDGPLTPQERRTIELHPEYGHEMVRGIGFLGEARAAILHHHERLDGSGYPYGLRGGQIPESARLVAVADAFDAMTSTRSYRRARPVATAVEELKRCAGTQFDPRMVGALARALDRHGWRTGASSDTAPPAPAGPRPVAGPGAGAPGAEAPRGNVPPGRHQDTHAQHARRGGTP
ncbi:HD-GYP domain-containing protein [Streptomyces sp. SP18CS02]|uniref:HD-GYP domain-containing protein n=1 Tax=Streptomyces sp. SP18CS02 TaxID=3002531 RepID=UPI002E76E8AC|nr:HD-GYP domain-containing protein [Streptomyces sp. SP18CS02]MEE1757323.1 HD-GYP domain-containing protein [Streptomyces sp. SP18CS02]